MARKDAISKNAVHLESVQNLKLFLNALALDSRHPCWQKFMQLWSLGA